MCEDNGLLNKVMIYLQLAAHIAVFVGHRKVFSTSNNWFHDFTLFALDIKAYDLYHAFVPYAAG